MNILPFSEQKSSLPNRHLIQGKSALKACQLSTLSLALSMALGNSAVQAQQLPNIGDAVRQTPAPVPSPAPASSLPSFGKLPSEPAMQALPGGGPSVQVKQFAVVGNRVIDSATLLALLQAEQGKTLSLAELDALATRLTRHYRASGYFVARAYIPAQEMSTGTLTIRIVEGNYGNFVLNNQSLVQSKIMQGLLDDIKDRDIVSLDTLERAMLIINDTPGAKVVQADVMPGEKVGTSDFAVSTVTTSAADGYVLLDNYGSAHTGKERLSFNADWNSPSGRGDRLSGSGMITRNSGLLNGRLAYSALVSSDGSRLEAALSRTNYKLGGVYAALDASGTANGADLNWTKPLKRTRNDSIELGLGFAYKDLKDDVASTNTQVGKRLTSLSGSIAQRREHTLLGLAGLSQTSASLTLGNLRFKDAAAQALDALGANTQGSYAKLNAAASRISLLSGKTRLSTSIKAQFALSNKGLDGAERMSVSGASGVAAYPTGELSGDHAVLMRADLAHSIVNSNTMQVSGSVFADYGWAKSISNNAASETSRKLSDLGLALSGQASNGMLFKVQVAHRVGGGAARSESVSRTRLLVQVGWAM